jgi:hypothetical protein
MVTACKAYITDGGTNHVWDQETPAVLKKIQVCKSVSFFIKQSSQLAAQSCSLCSFMKPCSLGSRHGVVWEYKRGLS